jgi:Tfp pilus assembly protein PilN
MAEGINLLPEDMQAKGRIPQPNTAPLPAIPRANSSEKSPILHLEKNNQPITPIANKPVNQPVAPIIKEIKPNNQLEPIIQQRQVINKQIIANNNAQKKINWQKITNWLFQAKSDEDQESQGINLVPKETELLSFKSIINRIVLRILPAIVIIVGAYLLAQTYSVYIKQKTEALAKQLSNNIQISESDIAKLEKNASGLDRQVTVMRNILSRHIYWTRLLDFLEQSFIPEVYIRSLSAEGEGNIIIEGQTNSFTAVAKQYAALQNNPDVKAVLITGASRPTADEPIKFSIKLTVWPRILYPNAFVK